MNGREEHWPNYRDVAAQLHELKAKFERDGAYLRATNPAGFHRLRMKIRKLEQELRQGRMF